MSSRRHVRYNPLAVDEDDDYNGGRRFDPRFDYSPKAFDRVPWKSIVLAVFLLCLGCLLLFLSFFIFSGHMGGEKSQAYGLLVLGILTFLPGTQLIRQKCVFNWMVLKICLTVELVIWFNNLNHFSELCLTCFLMT
ncbi:hypothetical protein J1N35_020502 [Gossypium stocksii]|uniref:Transmembrane protein 230 n=1 Tax=Gossypium stocksii TaxID=47602 RepID=A0A9D3VCX8_9ROSI|nr:hypothetical protein J1N35_020502 [Gossypium stocksii]